MDFHVKPEVSSTITSTSRENSRGYKQHQTQIKDNIMINEKAHLEEGKGRNSTRMYGRGKEITPGCIS